MNSLEWCLRPDEMTVMINSYRGKDMPKKGVCKNFKGYACTSFEYFANRKPFMLISSKKLFWICKCLYYFVLPLFFPMRSCRRTWLKVKIWYWNLADWWSNRKRNFLIENLDRKSTLECSSIPIFDFDNYSQSIEEPLLNKIFCKGIIENLEKI